MAQFKKIDHVIIATQDLADALRLWERNVGLTDDEATKIVAFLETLK